MIAGELSGLGDWMLHCHMQHHSDMGMSTHFHVLDRQAGRGHRPAGITERDIRN